LANDVQVDIQVAICAKSKKMIPVLDAELGHPLSQS
jgi:hypothetical protein